MEKIGTSSSDDSFISPRDLRKKEKKKKFWRSSDQIDRVSLFLLSRCYRLFISDGPITDARWRPPPPSLGLERKTITHVLLTLVDG